MKYRDYMVEENENLSWCRPYIGNRVSIAINEGKPVGLIIDKQEIDPVYAGLLDGYKFTAEQLERAARAANPDYADYSGHDALRILLDGDVRECPCRECPWFSSCDAMDEQIGG